MRFIVLTSLALALVTSSMPINTDNPTTNVGSHLPPTLRTNQLAGLSGSGTSSGAASAEYKQLGTTVNGIVSGSTEAIPSSGSSSTVKPIDGVESVPRSLLSGTDSVFQGLSGAVSGATTQTQTGGGGPVSGTNTASAAGLLHGAADAGGTSGNGAIGDVASFAGAVPGASTAGSGFASGSGTHLSNEANGGASGTASGVVGGAVSGAAGPVAGAASGVAGVDTSYHA
ncbi:hypothetical protein BU15DRAFT_76781 [Melanogaster broomeanus]|nr:hypothetical protein BU15DRAFT_76781 [Melanogaster broomeanus]